ncbi:MAG TPA: hypothetical protein VFG87_17735, partial [Amycolatopsis sp.]|nr:hypothetical protein [Amycolatopsis sp.]
MIEALGRQAPTPPPGPPAGDQLCLAGVSEQVESGCPETFYEEAAAFDRVVAVLRDVADRFRNQARQLESAWSGSSA